MQSLRVDGNDNETFSPTPNSIAIASASDLYLLYNVVVGSERF